MSYGERTERINLRLTPLELAMLKQLADEQGFTQSDVIRQAIRKVYAEHCGDRIPKRTKR